MAEYAPNSEVRPTTWQRTGELRTVIVKSENAPQYQQLQVEWLCMENGKTEWRDVPIVEDNQPEEFFVACQKDFPRCSKGQSVSAGYAVKESECACHMARKATGA